MIAMVLDQDTQPFIDQLRRLFLVHVQRNLREKGHVASGKGYRSLETKLEQSGEDLILQLWGEDYLRWQNEGRKPGSMPPVTPLIKWVQRKGIESDIKKAKGIAFAIAKNMKRIGMHSNNKRLDLSKRNFIGEAQESIFPYMEEKMFEAFTAKFQSMTDEFAKEVEQYNR